MNEREEQAAAAQRAMRAARGNEKQREKVGQIPVDARDLFAGRSQKQLAEEASKRRQEEQE